MNLFTKYVVSNDGLRQRIANYVARGVTPIIDYAVEHNHSTFMIDDYVRTKALVIQKYPHDIHSLKPSALGMNYDTFDALVQVIAEHNSACVIDAEDYGIQGTIDLFANMAKMNASYNHVEIYKTYQMYRKDSMEHLLEDMEMFRTTNVKHCVKLVRGAYMHKDTKYNILFDTKKETDENYNRATKMMLEYAKSNEEQVRVMFATHNPKSIDTFATSTLPNVSHATLMGMDKHLRFGDPSYKVNRVVHVPFGPYSRTYPYMIRRLLENNPVLDKLTSISIDIPEKPKTLSHLYYKSNVI